MEEVIMTSLRWAPNVGIGCALLLSAGTLPLLAQTPPPIRFEVPAVVDPIHTNGEPDIGIDPFGRVFVSGPTWTGTQRSVWLGSVDRLAKTQPMYISKIIGSSGFCNQASSRFRKSLSFALALV